MGMGGLTVSSNDIVIKSLNDRRLYRLLELENGFQALLVHDSEIYPEESSKAVQSDDEKDEEEEEDDKGDEDGSEEGDEDGEGYCNEAGGKGIEAATQTKKVAAAMRVGIGSFPDPFEAQGLAHFLVVSFHTQTSLRGNWRRPFSFKLSLREHMLFTGSDEFPDENEAMRWSDFFLSATCTLGFISLCKALIHFLRWVWVMLLRPPKNLTHYGSWAIITGSTDGIGKALAFELASKGLNLVLVGRNPQKLEATSKEIKDKHGGHVEIKFVVMDFQNVSREEIIRRIEEATEGLDVGLLINNAGLAEPYPRFFHEDDWELIDAIIKVNMEGATWVTKAVLPGMINKKKGAIINIGSASTVVVPSYPLCALYAATKAYLAMFSRCIGLEYKAQGIDIQCQVPLFVATNMTKMKVSLFIPSPEMYSKASTRWFGYYETLCVPYSLHSLQCLFIRMFPDALLNWCMLRHHLYWRKRGLLKYSKMKALAASKPNTNT